MTSKNFKRKNSELLKELIHCFLAVIDHEVDSRIRRGMWGTAVKQERGFE